MQQSWITVFIITINYLFFSNFSQLVELVKFFSMWLRRVFPYNYFTFFCMYYCSSLHIIILNNLNFVLQEDFQFCCFIIGVFSKIKIDLVLVSSIFLNLFRYLIFNLIFHLACFVVLFLTFLS